MLLDTPTALPLDADACTEDLLLIATGRGDELAPARRDHLLEAVATDPGVAALLQDAQALAGGAVAAQSEITAESTVHAEADGFAPTLRRSPDDAPTPPAPAPPAFRFPGNAVKVAFAIAACLTVALGVWRFADPPTAQVASTPTGLFDQPGLIVPSGVEESPADGTPDPATALAAPGSSRDSALIASAALTGAFGLAWMLLKPGRQPDPAG